MSASLTSLLRPSLHSRKTSPSSTSTHLALELAIVSSAPSARVIDDSKADGAACRRTWRRAATELFDLAVVPRQQPSRPVPVEVDAAVAGPQARALALRGQQRHDRGADDLHIAPRRLVREAGGSHPAAALAPAATYCSRLCGGGRSARAATASRLANSPSECPPMPSATAQSPRSGCSRHASSLTSRTRPAWERDADVQRNGLDSMLAPAYGLATPKLKFSAFWPALTLITALAAVFSTSMVWN